MFADDCVVYHTVTNTSDQLALQNDLTCVQDWCSKWLMELNPPTCKDMSFHRKRNTPFLPLLNLWPNLDLTSSYEYLGVTLCEDLIWNAHMTTESSD